MWRWEQVRRAICILQKALFPHGPVTLGLPHSWPGTAMLWSSLPFYLRGPGGTLFHVPKWLRLPSYQGPT